MEEKNVKHVVRNVGIYEKYVKRAFDFMLAISLLIVLFPALLIVYVLIKLEEPGSSAIFKQIRCGKDNKPFEVYKFRSMKSSAPANMSTKEFEDSDKYITKLGKFIRKTSIDELPQLVNIIKGEMSFVGPRPLIFEEAEILEVRERLSANRVLPGITGSAQINGRDVVGDEAKAEMDAEYSMNIGLRNDLKLLFVTIPVVLMRQGNKDDEAVEVYESAEIHDIRDVREASEQRIRRPELDLDVVNK